MLSPRCSKSNASLILSRSIVCVTNSSIIKSFCIYESTSFGALSTLFHPPNAVPFHVLPVTNWNGLVLISVPDGATPTITETPQPLQADSCQTKSSFQDRVKGKEVRFSYQSRSHCMNVSNAFESIIEPTVFLHNNLLNGCITKIFRIDELGSAESFRNFKFARIDVNAHNLRSTSFLATHQCG